VVKGETPRFKTLPLSSTKTISPKTLPTGVASLAKAPELAKKYCVGYRNIEIQYNNEHFLCRMYDYYNTRGCLYYYVNEKIITSIPTGCHNGKEIADGIYYGDDIYYNYKCGDELSSAKEELFTDESIPYHERRDFFGSNPIFVSSINEVPLNDSLKELVKKYCDNTSIAIRFNNTDFMCVMGKEEYSYDEDGCLPPPPTDDSREIFLTFEDDCLNIIKYTSDVYTSNDEKLASCDTKFMDNWAYYIVGSKRVLKSPTNPSAKTITTNPMTISITVTKTIPETTTKTVPDSLLKTIPDTIAKTVPDTLLKTIPNTILKTIPNTILKTIPNTIVNTIQNTSLGRVILTKKPLRTFRHW